MSDRNLVTLIAVVAAAVGVFSIIHAEPLVWQMGSSAQSEFTKGLTLLVGLWLLAVRFMSFFILPILLTCLSIWIIIGIWNRERVAYAVVASLSIAVFILPIDVIADKVHRGYRNYFSSQWRDSKIDEYAGCHQSKSVLRYTDSEFSEHWKEDTEIYGFNEVDVDEVMLNRCAPGKVQDANEEVIEYQHNFLNREFSVLNPNWVPSQPSAPKEEVVVDMTDWKSYRNEKYGISIKYPAEWEVQVQNESIAIYQGANGVKLYPSGRSGSSCYLAGMTGDFEQMEFADFTEEFFTLQESNGKLKTCSTDLDNYPRNWNEMALIEMGYDASLKATVKNIVESIIFLQETIDAASLKLYGSRIGMQGAKNIDTSDWKNESNTKIAFSFKYPSGSKITNEGNCYRVEYGQGFVIFLLPIEGDMRCGARTGVGVLPDNTVVTDRLKIQEKEYLAPGFRAIMDTKGEMFYKPETRYFYDFHHMLSIDGDLGSCQKDCIKIGYGIYKETPTPLSKSEVDRTMGSLRAIVESLQYEK
ncbi:MAG: hypothetical protein IPJ68_04475 [Candidatus Moraniibacteriota bacterium]|nr:MAG: hypothetical protein IPJ68_04475 [Candidatus Moranbacteria bacterium]